MKNNEYFTIQVMPLALGLFYDLPNCDKAKILELMKNEFTYFVNCLTSANNDNACCKLLEKVREL